MASAILIILHFKLAYASHKDHDELYRLHKNRSAIKIKVWVERIKEGLKRNKQTHNRLKLNGMNHVANANVDDEIFE